MPRRAGTYDATVATTSSTSAVTANVHGSSGSTSNNSRSSSRVSTPPRPAPVATPTTTSRSAWPSTRRKHRRRRRAERHADADLLRPLPHRVRHHAVDADRRERERDEREHADQHRDRARPRDRVADDLFERADLDGRFRFHRAHDASSRCCASDERILPGADEEAHGAAGTLRARDDRWSAEAARPATSWCRRRRRRSSIRCPSCRRRDRR